MAESVDLAIGRDLNWLMEWAPAIVVVCVRPDGPLEAMALRSPHRRNPFA